MGTNDSELHLEMRYNDLVLCFFFFPLPLCANTTICRLSCVLDACTSWDPQGLSSSVQGLFLPYVKMWDSICM